MPIPQIDVASFGWADLTRPSHPLIYPPASLGRPSHLPHTRRSFLVYVAVALGLIVLAVVSIVGSVVSGQSVSMVASVLGVAFPAAMVWTLTLRYFARAPGFAMFLFVLLVIGFGTALLAQVSAILYSGFGSAARTGPLLLGLVVSFLVVLLFFVAFIKTFTALGQESTHRRRLGGDIERAKREVPIAVLERRVHGVPGEGLDNATDRFGAVNVAIGQLGERMTATLLEELLVMPGVQIVHGLKFPGSRSADVDHAIVAGNRVAFIDTKLWKPAAYVMDPSGTILENGRMNVHRQSNHSAAVEKLAALLPHCDVRGWIVIHPQSDGDFNVTSRNVYARTQLVDAYSLLREAGEWLSAEGKNLNLLVMAEVLRHRNW